MSRLKENECEVICWERTPTDSRDTASSVASGIIPRHIAKRVALEIDEGLGRRPAWWLSKFGLKAGESLAAGHGVMVEYASGTKRTYYAQEDK